jgi:chemotaxis protein methyltransferase CheR
MRSREPSLPTMSEEEFLLLNETISGRFGLHYPEHKKEMLESRLRPRLEALSLRHFFDYYLLLHYNGEGEMGHLARLVSNNETYFFRETDQFEALFGPGLAMLERRRGGPLRLLSAGCSSGEEPYTLNIFARERLLACGLAGIAIDGFDIDAERVGMARAAEYGASSLRALTPEQIATYFRPAEEGRHRLREPFRQGVRVERGNLLDPASYRHPLGYDAVFCRNVLIYFSETALHRAVDVFARVLVPGGLLFLGHSESIIGLSPHFETLRFKRCLGYRRVP